MTKKILFAFVAMMMTIMCVSCDTEQSTAEKFFRCCSNRQYTEAKGYLDEISNDFDKYSSKDKSAVMIGLKTLVTYTKDPELGDAFITYYSKVKDDKTVELDKDAASLCEWIENGFTTGLDYTDDCATAPELVADPRDTICPCCLDSL